MTTPVQRWRALWRRFWPRGLHWPLVALLLSALALPAAVFAPLAWQERLALLQEGQETATRVVTSIAAHVEAALETHSIVLDQIELQLAERQWSEIEADHRLRKNMGELARRLPQIRSIFLLDASGKLRQFGSDSHVIPAVGTSFASEEWFLAHAGGSRRGLYISSPFTGPGGTRQFSVSIPRRTAAGAFDGVLAVTIQLSYFTEFWERITPEVKYVVPLMKSDGTMLVRYPADETPRLLPSSPFMQQIARQPGEGFYTAVSRVDGIERLNAYRRVGRHPLYVSYSVEKRAWLVPWRDRALLYGVLGLLTTLALAVVGLLALRGVYRANADLVQQRSELRALFDLVPAQVWVKDHTGKLVEMNERAANQFGVDLEHALGRDIDEVLPGESAEAEEDQELLRHGVPLIGRVHRCVSPDGVETWFQSDKVAYRDDTGRTMGILVMRHDITERKRAEAELVEYRQQLEQLVDRRTRDLERANRELETFSYAVAHDLRAPVQAISGFTKVLEERLTSSVGDRERHLLSRISVNSARMDRLIQGLLVLANLGRADLVLRKVDASGTAREMFTLLTEPDPSMRARFACAEGIVLNADPRLLEVVLQNLLANSLKFSKEEKDPLIEFGRRADGCLFVRDNGVGFNSREAVNLFQPFSRIHQESRFEGSGVGLATVKRIIERHGGRIWAESEVGCGATFLFTWPEG